MTKVKTTTAFVMVLVFIITALFYLLQRPLASNVLYLLSPLLAVLGGLYAVKTFKLSSTTGQVFALLTAGLTCFFIGDLLFFSYQFIFHINPFPSVADIFYIAAYPLLFAGFMRAILSHKVHWHNFSKVYLYLILFLLLMLAIVVFYFGVYQAYMPGESAASNIISIAYGIGDLIIIIPSLFLLKIILDFRGGKLFNSWVMMLVALMLLLTSDILYAVYRQSYNAIIFPYTLIDLVFAANYLLFSFSFFYTSLTVKDLEHKLKRRLLK